MDRKPGSRGKGLIFKRLVSAVCPIVITDQGSWFTRQKHSHKTCNSSTHADARSDKGCAGFACVGFIRVVPEREIELSCTTSDQEEGSRPEKGPTDLESTFVLADALPEAVSQS